MIKIAGIILIALILTVLLNRMGSELYIFIPICSAVIIFIFVIDYVRQISAKLSGLTADISYLAPYMGVMLKVILITLLSQFVSSVCVDCGENALAFQTRLASKILIVAASIPIFEAAISVITGLLK